MCSIFGPYTYIIFGFQNSFPPKVHFSYKKYQCSQKYYKILFKKNSFGTINVVKITKQSLCKANSFACSLANRASGSHITKKMFWWNSFCKNYKEYYKNNFSKELFCNSCGNSMTSSDRPSPEPILKKETSPAVLGGEHSGNALEASNALNYRVWGIPAVLLRGIPGNALRAFPGSFRNFSGISSGKSQPYWGYSPQYTLARKDCIHIFGIRLICCQRFG